MSCPSKIHTMYARRGAPRYITSIQCMDCGDYVSLGPANDRVPKRELSLCAFYQALDRLRLAATSAVPPAGLEPALDAV